MKIINNVEFKNLSTWIEFQELCADLLVAEGFYNVRPAGTHQDRGMDIYAEQDLGNSSEYRNTIKWMVQCKHYSKSEKIVGEKEIAGIQEYLENHNCDGIFFITDTKFTASATTKIITFDKTKRHTYHARFWDGHDLSQRLLKHKSIFNQYFELDIGNIELIKQDVYTFRDPASAWYINREEERNLVEHLNKLNVEKSTNLFITGPSGVGKSSFLNRAEEIIHESGSTSIRRTVLLETPQELIAALSEDIRNRLGQLQIQKPERNVSPPSDFQICLKCLIKQNRKPVIFIIDQFERIFERGPYWDVHAIKSAWRAFMDIIKPTISSGLVSWIIAAREHYYFILFPDETSMRFDNFSWITLSEFREYKAKKLLRKLCILTDIKITDSAVDTFITGTGNFPQNIILSFINLCESNQSKNLITSKFLQTVKPWLNVFENDYNRLTSEKQKLVILAMAHTQKEVCTIGEIKSRIESKLKIFEDELRSTLRSIQDDLYLIRQPERDHFTFYHSGFGRYLFDRHYDDFPSEWQKFEARIIKEEKRQEFYDYFTSALSSIIHQLKNHIYVQNDYLYKLGEQKLDKNSIGLIEKLSQNTNLMKSTLNAFTDFTRRGNIRPKSQIDVYQTLKKVIELLETRLAKLSIQLVLPVIKDKVVVLAESNLLEQAFLNILMNSLDSMSKGGLIKINISIHPNFYEIVIKDDGSGIPSDFIEKIFEPYFTTKIDGTGLGLSIVKKIIEENIAGRIYITSQEMKGTSVFIELPKIKEQKK